MEAGDSVVLQPRPSLRRACLAIGSDASQSGTPEAGAPTDDAAAIAARRQRDKDRAKAREDSRAATPNQPAPLPAAGPKRITVTVTYDESGRVTQASGGDASAIRIARQKRFPPGKAGSATVTIPIN